MLKYHHKDYQEYLDAQIEKNKRKFNNVWIEEKEMNLIESIISQYVPNASIPGNLNGICHGVRNGFEVKELRKRFETDKIIGTEISPTAKDVPNTVQMDFHEVPNNWVGKYDFIYSNSLDHSYDPDKCLDAWMSELKPSGICLIHWMKTNENKIDAADCFGASLEEYKEMIQGKYHIISMYGYPGRKIFVVGKYLEIKEDPKKPDNEKVLKCISCNVEFIGKFERNNPHFQAGYQGICPKCGNWYYDKLEVEDDLITSTNPKLIYLHDEMYSLVDDNNQIINLTYGELINLVKSAAGLYHKYNGTEAIGKYWIDLDVLP